MLFVRRGLQCAEALLGALILCLLCAWWVYAARFRGEAKVPGLGNFEENVRKLPPVANDRFRFAVLGDPHEGQCIYQELMRRAFDLGAAFVVCTGDLVDGATRESFELFNHMYKELGPAALPMFTAIGNHDECPQRLFEEYYGPEDFAFLHGDSVFIFTNNNNAGRHEQCARFVKEQIARFKDRARHVFVVFHKPIVDHLWHGRMTANRRKSAYMYEVLDSEKVDAVLMGHFHGYVREMYKGTLLLVTGGAGYRLHDDNGFYHLVLIDVAPEGITDTLVRLDARRRLRDLVRVEAVVGYPVVFGSWWRLLSALLVGTLLLLDGARRLLRKQQGDSPLGIDGPPTPSRTAPP